MSLGARTFPSVVLLLSIVVTLNAQDSTNTFDASVASGRNFEKAEFRLWLPKDAARVRGVVVLMPGSNGDARSEVNDSIWQAFANRHELALVGSRLTDRPHEQSFIEEYVNVPQGSGQALLDGIDALAKQTQHAELTTAPLLLWGMSAGGQFNYEFVAWRPDRVLAFVVNKGGIYYSALLPRAARNVPGLFFIGGKDIEFRNNTIAGLFAVNRRGGALWGLAEEPGIGHAVGRSRDLTLIFFEDVLKLRLPQSSSLTLQPIAEASGFLGDLKAKTFQKQTGAAPNYPTAWLPTERIARAWEAMVNERPFEP